MKLRKNLLLVLMLVLGLSLVVTGCGSTPAEDATAPGEGTEEVAQGDGSWARVQEAGKVTFGLDDAYPPMGYRDETGELIGFDIDVANAIGEKLGVEVEFVAAEWAGIETSLLTGKFDGIISGMNMRPERVEVMDYVPYGIATQVVVVPADSPYVDQVEDVEFFKDKVIGTQTNSTGYTECVALGFDDNNMKLYNQFPQAFLDLDNGRLDAIVTDSFTAVEWLETGNYVKVGADVKGTPATGDDHSEMIGIAFNPADAELRDKVQGAFAELLADGTITELSNKWIGGMDITEGLEERQTNYLSKFE